MSMIQRHNLIEFTEQYRRMIQIGKVVSVVDPEHPEYIDELFVVVGFQKDIYGFNDLIAIMDDKGRVFLTNIDRLILKAMFTIDDIFPSEPTDILWIDKES
ncbi:MAG: hypothetical protein ACTSU7_00610 [Candidatus Heimdallarchaeaceae archaeon]